MRYPSSHRVGIPQLDPQTEVRKEIVRGDVADEPVMLAPPRVVDYEGRRPLDRVLLHQGSGVVPEALGSNGDETLLEEPLNLIVGIRTRIHLGAADSAVEPEVLENRLAGLPRLFQRNAYISLPLDPGHLSPPRTG